MIVLRSKGFSIRPYAKNMIKESEKLLESGANKWDIVKRLVRAKDAYSKSSRKVTSLNPIKLMKNSKDAEDSEFAISRHLYKLLNKK